MRAGRLNQSIFIDKPILTKTDSGSEEIHFTPFIHCRAEVVQKGGNVTLENGDVFHTHSVIFTIRKFYDDVNENCRITWKNRHYRINHIEFHEDSQNIAINTELVNDFEIEKEYT